MGQFRTVSWTLKSSNNLDDVIAFYKQELPEAEEGQTDRIYLEQDTLKFTPGRLRKILQIRDCPCFAYMV